MTFHEPTHLCTSLWTRPVDNSAQGVMKPPGPARQRAAVSHSLVAEVPPDVLVGPGPKRPDGGPWRTPHALRDFLPTDCPPVTVRLWRMATSIQKVRRSSSAMASGDGGSGAVVVAEIVRGQAARIHLRSTFPQPCGGGATRPRRPQ